MLISGLSDTTTPPVAFHPLEQAGKIQEIMRASHRWYG